MNSTDKQEEDAALSIGATICIETEEDGWVEGDIVLIRSFPKTKREKRHRMKCIIKTSETEDTIHGYHDIVGGLKSEIQLCDMDWWRVHKDDEVTSTDTCHAQWVAGSEHKQGRKKQRHVGTPGRNSSTVERLALRTKSRATPKEIERE